MNPAILPFNGRILRICAALSIAALVLGFAVLKPSVSSGRSSIGNIRLVSVDGEQFTLSGLRGKVVVLDFFGIRCAHSRDHIRETMVKFSQEDFSRGLQLIGVESESSSVTQVRNFIKDQGIGYPVAQVDEATFVRFVNSRDLSAPQSLVFGRDGKLLLHTLGFNSKNEADIRSAIQKALDAK